MSKIVLGNHLSVIVPFADRDKVQKFYCGVLGGIVTRSDPERDFIRLGDDFFAFLCGDVPDISEYLRTARSVWLELKSDDVDGTSRHILESGLVQKLEMPDPHLYFQAPGGQCLRLVGTTEDLSFYERGRRGYRRRSDEIRSECGEAAGYTIRGDRKVERLIQSSVCSPCSRGLGTSEVQSVAHWTEARPLA